METDKNPIPSYGIRIDKEGNWYYLGAEMLRKEIIQYFYQHLTKDPDGRHIIELENDRCFIEVEDCAFVVKAVNINGNKEKAGCYALLSDDSIEILDVNTIRFSDANVPYCLVKEGRFEARFSRAAYYQLAEAMGFDEATDRYFINAGNEKIYIKQ